MTTRFRLRHFWNLLPLYLLYRGLLRDARQAPGLVRHAFLFESLLVCWTLSIWESEADVIRFSNVSLHLQAVRRANRLCREIWSGYWRLDAISGSANRWSGSAPWPPLAAQTEVPDRRAQQPARDGERT